MYDRGAIDILGVVSTLWCLLKQSEDLVVLLDYDC